MLRPYRDRSLMASTHSDESSAYGERHSRCRGGAGASSPARAVFLRDTPVAGEAMAAAVLASLLVLVLASGCRTPASLSPAPTPAAAELPAPSSPGPKPAPTPAPLPARTPAAVLQRQFVETMGVVKTNMALLSRDDWSTAAYMDRVLAESRHERQEAFGHVLVLLRRRIKLEAATLVSLGRAARLYEDLRGSRADYNAELRDLAGMAEADLDDLTDDLREQVDALSKVMGGAELDLFQDFGAEKVALIARLKQQQLAAVPDQSAYFERLAALVRTSMVADKYQLISFQYVAKAMHMSDRLQQIHDVMADVSVADYISDLGAAEMDAANMVSVLNHSFASACAGAVPGPQVSRTRPLLDGEVRITPSRGLGGTYYVGEAIHFTIRAARDCDFILLHRDSAGTVQQLCPNRYSKHENRLKANVPLTIPGDTLPYEFAATEPLGVETITLICMDRYRYDPAMDRMEVDPATLRPNREKPAPYFAMRGIDIRPRTETLSCGVAYDSGLFAAPGSGKAVRVETFIRVKRR